MGQMFLPITTQMRTQMLSVGCFKGERSGHPIHPCSSARLGLCSGAAALVLGPGVTGRTPETTACGLFHRAL